ncbi:Y-family DNA polymerase [Mucilaginibacter agri]|uniref:DNA polymerase Y family protein n=1 Tax=Mucilaginibacter agri TaxID=2695265 RepID=A0A966DTG3_9SPHI|nr:DNA polymerase Y family protein [Mucilaginibacter agri]NCD71228.1 DNA polymerase Y family protein [Mucilaginibacter agri]
MARRFLSIWFRYLTTDWLTIRKPELQTLPFVFATPVHGRMTVTAANALAEAQGITPGNVLADAKAIIANLEVFDEKPDRAAKLLKGLGLWCIRYTPIIALDLPDGLILDISGCAHLWDGEHAYLSEIVSRLQSKGYHARAAIADTIGAAWAIARFGHGAPIVKSNELRTNLLSLPANALRLDPVVLERLQKLGLRTVKSFISMPRSALRRRFGKELLLRVDQALGEEDEPLQLIKPVEPYQERLPCMEPIRTATGIEIAIQRLLENLCQRLQEEGKGLRTAILKCYRIDGKVIKVEIGTNQASHHTGHLFKLFELKIPTIEPALGIELFILEAIKVEDVAQIQEALWGKKVGLDNPNVIELLDRIANKVGPTAIRRYLPDEHYWPERSIKQVSSLQQKPAIAWRVDRPRPIQLLPRPEPVEVAAPIPDYPPMLFIYQGKKHIIKKADGPERIEREWWIEAGEHRDYYQVEDEAGCRYWLFRSGHYTGEQSNQWFIHGFFA